MPLNPYFLNGSPTEQKLIQDLVNEQIKMFGQDVVYMPRKMINEKTILKEVIVSKFDDNFRLEAYIATQSGFGGSGDILTKFGIRTTDEITFIVSKERFETFISPFIIDMEDIEVATRPQEGDLIYLPLDNSLFEIKYVEVKKPFYQLNNLYTYELRCEIFEYEDEIVDTGIEEVDKSVEKFGYILTLYMTQPNYTGAIATAGLSSNRAPYPGNKSIQYIDILNGGYGYPGPPVVKIANGPTNSINATAVAIMTSTPANTGFSVDKILIIDPGIGYTTPPSVSVLSSTGGGFIGTAILSENVLGPVAISTGGYGYMSSPNVSISTSPTNQNAIARAYINSNQQVAQIGYINAGAGYTTGQNLSIDSPVGIASGNYTFNEIVRGSASGTNGYVKEWNADTRVLKLSIVDGTFAAGEVIVGAAASYTVSAIVTDDIYDKYNENLQIEKEGLRIVDFDVKNPFGEI